MLSTHMSQIGKSHEGYGQTKLRQHVSDKIPQRLERFWIEDIYSDGVGSKQNDGDGDGGDAGFQSVAVTTLPPL